MRTRAVAAALTVAIALLALPAAPALADDPVPAPSPTDSATPAPSTPAVPTTPDVPVTPATPVTPPRLKLPLRKGDLGPLVAKAQDRLVWLGYPIGVTNIRTDSFGESTRTAVRHFQVKFFLPATGVIDKRTWDAIARVSGPIGRLPKACTEETSLCADKTQKIIRWVVKGKVRATFDARFGLPGMDTGDGYFRVNRKSRDHVSSLYHTWMPYAMFFNGGEAVHYSPYFDRDGYNGGSHGCVGIRDIKDAAWLFDRVPMGTRVYVYSS